MTYDTTVTAELAWEITMAKEDDNEGNAEKQKGGGTAQYYLLGCTYAEIEQYSGISHGSIVNIVREFESGKLDIPGTPFDQVNDLHKLSSDLKKKEISTSQALLGLSFFERIHGLGILPDHLAQWAELMKKLTTEGFPAEDFLNSALRLHQLEESGNKTYEVLIEEYERAKGNLGQFKIQADSMAEKRTILSKEIDSTLMQLERIKKAKGKLENEVDGLTAKGKSLKSKVDENKAESLRLAREVRELKRRKVKLSSEVDGMEESLVRLNDIGFLDEDLLRLNTIIKRIAKDSEAGQKEVKERFFAALATFKDITELQKCQVAETVKLEDLTNKISLLTGEIAGLEKQRDILRGDIKESATSAVQQITDAGQNAVTQLQQQAESLKGQLDSLFAQALKVAGVIGEMNAMVKKGEDSGKTLNSFIEEVTGKLGRN